MFTTSINSIRTKTNNTNHFKTILTLNNQEFEVFEGLIVSKLMYFIHKPPRTTHFLFKLNYPSHRRHEGGLTTCSKNYKTYFFRDL